MAEHEPPHYQPAVETPVSDEGHQPTPADSELQGMVEQHYRPLMGYALSRLGCPEDAADAVQTTYLNAWSAREQFEPGTNAQSWLFRILDNHLIGQARRRSKRPEGLVSDPDYIEERIVDPETTVGLDHSLDIKGALKVVMGLKSGRVVLVGSTVLPRREAWQRLGYSNPAQYDQALTRAKDTARERLHGAGYGDLFEDEAA